VSFRGRHGPLPKTEPLFIRLSPDTRMTDKPIKILLIDQFESDRTSLHRCLTRGNREVLVYEAVTGERGLSLFKSVLPDVVVMEMKQQDMFGIEVLNLIKIQMDGKPASVYVWTRLNNDVLRSAAALLGIQGYFSKTSGSEVALSQAILKAPDL
jgi:diguanylate cyclase